VVIWRSLDYACRVEAHDLVPLPSEISTLGYFQEDAEEYRGVYVAEDVSTDVAVDVAEDVVDAVDVPEDVTEDVRYAVAVAEAVGAAVDPY
jgi:hypothetical protein